MLKTIDYEAVFNGLMITFAVRTPASKESGKWRSHTFVPPSPIHWKFHFPPSAVTPINKKDAHL